MLKFDDGSAFACGAQPYEFRPATSTDSSNRILVTIEINERQYRAMLDTGAPYLICNPGLAAWLGLDPAAALYSKAVTIRGTTIQGSIHRLGLKLVAEAGDGLDIQATAFVPDAADEEAWPDLPAIVGLDGCLERVRFAIDTSTETFYFGPHL